VRVADYACQSEKGDFLVYIGRANPDKGPTVAIEVRGAPVSRWR